MNAKRTWSKEARLIALVGGMLGGVALLWLFRAAISPLAIAALFAYVFSPVVDFLTRRTRLHRVLAVLIVYVLMVCLLAAIPAVLTPMIVNQVQVMELDLESLIANYQALRATPYILGNWVVYPWHILPEWPGVSTDILNPLVDNSLHIVEVVTTNFIWVLVVLVTIYYLMLDGYKLRTWLIRIVPDEYQADAGHLSEQLRHVWKDYLRSQLAFMFVVGVVDSIVWLAIGLPGAILLGFLTGLTSFVHEIGAVVSGALSVGVALLGGSHFLPLSNFWFAVVVFILYMILTAAKNIWIRPVIVGRHVHLHSGVVFVIILTALVLYGALAAFIAVPVFVSLLVIGRYFRRRILGRPPFPEGVDPSEYFSLPHSSQESATPPKPES
jgi:predicted PurR-regulated permease PerM